MTYPLRSIKTLAQLGIVFFTMPFALAQQCTTTQSVTTTTVVPGSGSGSGSVLNTFAGGRIQYGGDPNGTCHLRFFNGGQVNTGAGRLGTEGPCPAKSSSGTTATLTASGTPVGQQSLAPFQTPSGGSSQMIENSITRNLPAGDYSDITVRNNAFSTIAGSSRIGTLNMQGCNGAGVTFAPGTYFIDQLNWGAGCRINTPGPGNVTLNIRQTLTINGGPTCANYSNCGDISESNMALQASDRLTINVYQGNVVTQGAIQIAASIYVHAGDFLQGNGTPFALAGQVIARNVTGQNNVGTHFYYQGGSSAPTTVTTTQTIVVPVLNDSFYSLAPPATPARSLVGSLVYIGSQRDKDLAGNPGISGHMRAFALAADGSLATTPSWDAAALMTVADRSNRIYTRDTAGNLVLLRDVDAAAFAGGPTLNVAGLKLSIINPTSDATLAAGRTAGSLLGRPWRTAPVIAGASVIFATDDGMLYSINKTTGALNWGFFPRELLPAATDPAALMNSHAWGQIDFVQHGGASYVVGTAMGGALHFAMRLNADGSLNGMSFNDYRAGGVSPTSPFGGAAPTMPIIRTGAYTGKVAYVVNNRVVSRRLDGSGPTVQTPVISPAITSNLIYNDDNEVHFGVANGEVRRMTLAGVYCCSAGTVTAGQPVLGLNAARATIGGSTNLLIVANSATEVATFSGNTESWRAGVTGAAAGGTISSAVTIFEGKVYFPVTRTTGCQKDGYIQGPYDLKTGTNGSSGIRRNGSALSGLINSIGPGESLRVTTSRIGSRRFAFGFGGQGTGGSHNWNPFEHTSPEDTTTRRRLLWRELTNFN